MCACHRHPPMVKPLALILEYAETIVPAVDLGSIGEPDGVSLVTLLRGAKHREMLEQGHLILLTTGNLADLNPNLLLSRHVAQIIEAPPPDRAGRIHFLEYLLARGKYDLALTPQDLANLAAGLSFRVVRALLRQSRRQPGRSPVTPGTR